MPIVREDLFRRSHEMRLSKNQNVFSDLVNVDDFGKGKMQSVFKSAKRQKEKDATIASMNHHL